MVKIDHNRPQERKENKHLFSSKMFTGKALLPILALLIGLIVASFQLKGRSHSIVRVKRRNESSLKSSHVKNWARLLHTAQLWWETCIARVTQFYFYCFVTQSETNIVRMPLIGGTEAQREGPWPACLGISGEECKTIIEANASDLRGNVKIIPQDSMMTMDFRTDRVRIMVDDDGLVTRIPQRG
jgi:hypothetical protein